MRALHTFLKALTVCLPVLVLLARMSAASREPMWSTLIEGPFAFEYPPAAEKTVSYLVRTCPLLEKRIKEDLGLDTLVPVRIILVTDMEQFAARQPAGAVVPSWSAGVAYPEQGIILLKSPAMLLGSQYDFEKVLFHEVAHIALHQALCRSPGGNHEVVDGTAIGGPDPLETCSIPRWLHEGYAMYLAREWSLEREIVLGKAVVQDRLIPLGSLVSEFPEEEHRAELAYAESADLVHFLRNEYGAVPFGNFIAELGAGSRFGKAVRTTFGITFQEVEDAWRRHLKRRYHTLSVLGSLSLVWAAASLLLLAAYARKRIRARNIVRDWQETDEGPGGVPSPRHLAQPRRMTKKHYPKRHAQWRDHRRNHHDGRGEFFVAAELPGENIAYYRRGRPEQDDRHGEGLAPHAQKPHTEQRRSRQKDKLEQARQRNKDRFVPDLGTTQRSAYGEHRKRQRCLGDPIQRAGARERNLQRKPGAYHPGRRTNDNGVQGRLPDEPKPVRRSRQRVMGQQEKHHCEHVDHEGLECNEHRCLGDDVASVEIHKHRKPHKDEVGAGCPLGDDPSFSGGEPQGNEREHSGREKN